MIIEETRCPCCEKKILLEIHGWFLLRESMAELIGCVNGDPEVGSGTGGHGDAKFQNQVKKEYLSRVGTLSGYLRFPGRGSSPAPRVVPVSLNGRQDQESALRLEVGMAI